MGVDSNVLIFERIREERAAAAGPRAAVRAAFDRVWITIVDTHVASLIAAAMLFQFGTPAVRGFALTLAIGLLPTSSRRCSCRKRCSTWRYDGGPRRTER